MAANKGGRGRGNRGKQPNPPANRRNSKPTQANQEASNEKLLADAEAVEAQELSLLDGAAPPQIQVTGPVDADRFRKAIEQAMRAHDLADRRMRGHTEAASRLEKREKELEERAAKRREEFEREVEQRQSVLDEDSSRVASGQKELDEQLTRLAEREQELAESGKQLQDRQTELFALEQSARSDFAEFRHEQLKALRAELDEYRGQVEEQLQRRDKTAEERRAQAERELAARRDELAGMLASIEEQARAHQRLERQLVAREQWLEQDIADRLRDERSQLNLELDKARDEAGWWRQRYETTAEVAKQRAAELAERDAAALVLGNSPTEAAAELEALRRDNATLRSEAASRPHATQERLEESESHRRQLIADRDNLLRQNEELRRELAAGKISVLERENSRLINRALTSMNGTLRQELDRHTTQLENLQASTINEPPFPACAAMDDDAADTEEPALPSGMPRLPQLVQRVRDLIASSAGLYYSDRDLRCFLGGLAASKLHLLEGISGTGKTRLPNVFAEVIGARCETIAVAAEWRSPQDLLGYYNSFERKFYETEFMQALYRAQLPLYRGKPFFIVLDEMNLSHPEQYLSSVLSALGSDDPSLKRLRLMTARVNQGPDLLLDGRDLALPNNVWFVGTANRDETTVSFADKTYDRAHVLELPARRHTFEPADEAQPLVPISFDALMREFDHSRKKNADDADAVLGYFDGQLGDRLREGLRVSWGNRLDEQARAFVPVVRAAGGHLGEAADHLLATKVLRKLRGRVEVPHSELEALRDLIQSTWGKICSDTKPEKSVQVLQDEIRFRGLA